jgi:hypothetical protein
MYDRLIDRMLNLSIDSLLTQIEPMIRNRMKRTLYAHVMKHISTRFLFPQSTNYQRWAQDNFFCPVLSCPVVLLCPGGRQDRSGQDRTGPRAGQ